jgi:hypothetical protein
MSLKAEDASLECFIVSTCIIAICIWTLQQMNISLEAYKELL